MNNNLPLYKAEVTGWVEVYADSEAEAKQWAESYFAEKNPNRLAIRYERDNFEITSVTLEDREEVQKEIAKQRDDLAAKLDADIQRRTNASNKDDPASSMNNTRDASTKHSKAEKDNIEADKPAVKKSFWTGKPKA